MDMLVLTNNSFPINPYIYTTVDDSVFSTETIKHFDNDGFQLNRLEQIYYRAADIATPECLGVHSAQQTWLELAGEFEFVLDHSFIVARYAYTDSARDQLERMSAQFPQLKKYLLLQPKWGLDFALEYAGQDYIELLHIERDYSTLEEALEQKCYLELRLLDIDWHKVAQNLLRNRNKWQHLQGMARNDWKAEYLGFGRAEHTLKAF
jgi:hypothetical protein